MTENLETCKFLNFLMHEKYSIEEKPNPVIENHARSLGFTGKTQPLESVESLVSADPEMSHQIADFLFCILYTSEDAKKIKAKEFHLKNLKEFYGNKVVENKSFIAKYNKINQTKVKVNIPKLVVTRFPPEPSGYLHIGHAKAALWNQKLALNGKLIVRFDDTNPLKESKEFESSILEDLKLLGISDFRVTKSSESFDRIFNYALILIERGLAYTDDTDVDTMRAERTNGTPSRNRNQPPDETMRIFKQMERGEAPGFCLRAKISFDHLNKAMRDPVIYRRVDADHHSTGSRHFIYPTYDFTVPILDSIEGVTLALRTNEYRDRNLQYSWFLDSLQLENKPDIHDFSRLNFENTVISKRNMKFYVEKQFVSGWDDPRMCTLRGLKRLGMNMGALKEYILGQGMSQKTSVVSWDKIWALNKKVIDLSSPRYSAVEAKDSVQCFIVSSDLSSSEFEISSTPVVPEDAIIEKQVLKYKKNPDLGFKRVFYSSEILLSQCDAASLSLNEEFTLMNWGNAIVVSKETDNGLVTKLHLKLNLNGDYKITKNKINWISKYGSVMVKLFEYGNLQNDLETEDLEKKFNSDSKKSSWYLAEAAIGCETETIQFERLGFYYCDGNLKFNLIPYTKQKRSE